MAVWKVTRPFFLKTMSTNSREISTTADNNYEFLENKKMQQTIFYLKSIDNL